MMNKRAIAYPLLVGTDGKATHVLVPIEDYMKMMETRVPKEARPSGFSLFPGEVADKALLGVSPLRAWREYLGLTLEEVARRMGLAVPEYARLEDAAHPAQALLEGAASAFGIDPSQLLELYREKISPACQGITGE